MNIAVDIGNTNLKCLVSVPHTDNEFYVWTIPPIIDRLDDFVSQHLLRWGATTDTGKLMPSAHPQPITWHIIQTGKLHWQHLKKAILKIRPKDTFKLMTHRQIPLDINVKHPEKVGIDRLLAAFTAVQLHGDLPMLIVDAGTAITVDVVNEQIFCGGAILPGLTALSHVYPLISDKLPHVSIPAYPKSCDAIPPMFPGRNTEEALQSGLYWGTIGAIRQFYDIMVSKTKKTSVIITGGDAEYLLPGLFCVIPPKKIEHHYPLILEGINLLARLKG